MAFWKKSADPWDIDPDERRLASEPAEKAPGLLDTLRGDWDAMRAEWQETRESLKLPPEKCPWCGKEMERGYLLSGQWIYWQRKRPTALSLRGHAADALVINTEGGTLAGYRTAWRCGACEKMVLDVADIQPEAFLGIPARAPEEDTQAPESNIDHE